MQHKIHTYKGEDITVTWDARRCLHMAECVRSLRSVFNPDQRPWVQPSAAQATEVAAAVERCPTGALHYERHDGGAAESPDARNAVTLDPNGPLLARGDLTLTTLDGDLLLADTRVALCRCGASKNKPLCDNSHAETGFSDPGLVTKAPRPRPATGDSPGLRIACSDDGPLLCNGPFDVVDAEGNNHPLTRAALCRCGHSHNKPFCDGTHSQIGFKTRPENAE